MATGHRPFDGASDAAMYDALLHAAPLAPTSVRHELPVDLDLVIGRALEKERELRYQSAADLAADLKRLQRPSSSALAAVPPRGPRRARAWRTTAIAALLLASILAVALVVRRPLVDAPTTRFIVGPPPNAVFTLTGLVPPAMTVSVSPDGRHVLYLANRSGDRGRLWLRSIDSLTPARRHRRRHLSVLVARQPERRLFRRRDPETKGARGWHASHAGGKHERTWRHVEPRRRDPLRHG